MTGSTLSLNHRPFVAASSVFGTAVSTCLGNNLYSSQCFRKASIVFVESQISHQESSSASTSKPPPSPKSGPLQCHPCHLVFEAYTDLRHHHILSPSPVFCAECDTLFIDTLAMDSHGHSNAVNNENHRPGLVKESKGQATIVSTTKFLGQDFPHEFCGMCNMMFKSGAELQQHMATSHNHNYCKQCQVLFPTFKDLFAHSINRLSTHFCCKPCVLLFDTEADLISHWRTTTAHHNVCIRCSLGKSRAREFVTEAAHLMHIENHQDHWYCSACHIDYDTEAALEEHYQTNCLTYGTKKRKGISNERQEPTRRKKTGVVSCWCQWCDMEFDSEGSRDKHWYNSSAHFSCRKCSFVYNTQIERQAHWALMSEHHACFRCDEDHPNAAALVEHKRTSDRHVECKSCGQDFDGKDEYRKVKIPDSLITYC